MDIYAKDYEACTHHLLRKPICNRYCFLVAFSSWVHLDFETNANLSKSKQCQITTTVQHMKQTFSTNFRLRLTKTTKIQSYSLIFGSTGDFSL